MKTFIAFLFLLTLPAFAGVQLDIQVDGVDARGLKLDAFSTFTASNLTCLELVYGSILAVPALKKEIKKGSVQIKSSNLISINLPTSMADDGCGYGFSESVINVYQSDAEFFSVFIGKTGWSSSGLDLLNPENKLSLSCRGRSCSIRSNGVIVAKNKSYPKLRVNGSNPNGKAVLKLRIN